MNINTIRKIVLDTETTGMNKIGAHYKGHKIIEIGAVEILNRCITDKYFHVYINPNRKIDSEAFQIHGISNYFLRKKPIFSDIADEFLQFINGSELIIHNASFDIGFLNYEFKNFNIKFKKIEFFCTITDTLKIARRLFPGQRNTLDALCERYAIDNSHRVSHNALIDAKLLANVYLSMTGGQRKMKFMESVDLNTLNTVSYNEIVSQQLKVNHMQNTDKVQSLKVICASESEKLDHEKYLDFIQKMHNRCIWRE